MEQELKPCPFCGSKAIYADKGWGEDTHTIFCSKDKCHFLINLQIRERISKHSKKEMFKFWNTRSKESASKPAVEIAAGINQELLECLKLVVVGIPETGLETYIIAWVKAVIKNAEGK